VPTGVAENSTRHIDTLREMEAYKRQYQVRCSHHELEYSAKEKRITCVVCGKTWTFVQERGYSEVKQVFAAERDDYIPMR
jgi:ribosomal protein S27E